MKENTYKEEMKLAMKKICKALFGDFKIQAPKDYILIVFKVIYIIYSLPVLWFAAMMFMRSMGAIKSPEDEKVGPAKLVLFHIANIGWSLCMWVCIYGIITFKGNA